MASLRKKPSRRQAKPKLPRTQEQYNALSTRSKDAMDRAAHVLTEMRRGSSLSSAAREFGIDPRTVIRAAGPSLKKSVGGRYSVSRSDRVLRMLVVATTKGLAEIAIPKSGDATVIAEHWNAVETFLDGRGDADLSRFEGRTVTTARGERVELLTDRDELELLGAAGVLSFESIYARVA